MFDLVPTGQGLLTALGATLGLSVLLGIARFLHRRQERNYCESQFIAQHGCQSAAILQGEWPFSTDLLLEVAKADNARQILHFFISVLKRAGPTHYQWAIGTRSINTIDPENLEAMLSTQFEEFSLGVREQNFRPLLGHGIFTQNGTDWKHSRNLLRPIFNHQRSEYFGHIRRAVDDLLTRIQEDTRDGVVDLQPLFFLLTLDVTTAAILGRSTNGLRDRGGQIGLRFASAFDTGQHYLATRGRLGDLYWLIGGKKFKAACEFVHSFVDEIVAKALAEFTPSDGDGGRKEGYLFIDALISQTRDARVIRDQLVNVLLAGRDTTACLLSWTFRMLALHPDVQQQLREECLQLSSCRDGEIPTKDELKRMKLLNMTIQEVLRLYPSVPINMRTALKDTVLPVGGGPDAKAPIFVRRGEAVSYCVYGMHRRKDLYGDDADEFRPERWNPDNEGGKMPKNMGWAYLPFNGGPRICLGQEFALLEASYTVVRLLQSFKWIELADQETDDQRAHPRHTITLVVASANGCKLRLVPY